MGLHEVDVRQLLLLKVIDETLIKASPAVDELLDRVAAVGQDVQDAFVLFGGEFLDEFDDPRGGVHAETHQQAHRTSGY